MLTHSLHSRLIAVLLLVLPLTAGAADLREEGAVLLDELRCARCHRSEHEAPPGPALEGVGSRVRPEYLRRWLASPHEVKPGTAMPDLRVGEAVEALTHFLASLRVKDDAKALPGSVERGRHLYHAIGCVACHAPDADYVPPGLQSGTSAPKIERASVPLGKLGEKYTTASLQRFLLNPLAVRPAARMPRVPMTPEEAADLAAYLTGDAPVEPVFKPVPKLVAEGRAQFTTRGCAACHTAPGSTFTSKAKPLAQLTSGGCLDAQPRAGLPRYALSDQERDALRVALKQPVAPPPLAALNCYACHSRDGRGGPEPGRAAYFASVGEVDLGDEGRIPPALTGVGAKLQTAAIERTVRGAGAVRPYLATRMPDFGAAHAAALASIFTKADYHPRKEPIPNVGRNTVGREMIGTAGLTCIACHGLNGRKSLGVPAIDLMHATKRLRREWFHAYLVDPGALRPGTRMPSFWPGGLPANPKWGKGKPGTVHQIDSIWVYLTELDQSRLPEGMEEKGQYELKPKDAPIVFRTFMRNVGMQTIAVGFPQKIHVAFDAKDVRWALAWRGRFLDAEGTWEERAAPLAEPLSKDVAALAKEPQFTTAPGTNVIFGGYRLDTHGVPIFLYRVGATEIEDRVEPNAANLRRTLTLRGKGPLVFRPADHEKIVSGSAAPVVFDAKGTATITTEITW